MGENLDDRGAAAPCARRCSGPPSRAAGSRRRDPSTFPAPLRRGRVRRRSTSTSRDQRRDPDSLLSFFRQLIRRLPRVPGAGLGHGPRCWTGRTPRRCSPTASDVDDVAVVAVHNFADREVTATLPLTGLAGRALFDVLAADGSTVKVGDDATLELKLPPYGFRWLRSTP